MDFELSEDQVMLMEDNNLGFISNGHLDDPDLRDELYDRR